MSNENELKSNLELTVSIQKVINDIGSKFLNIDAFNFDESIMHALNQLAELVNADRSYLFSYDFEQNQMTNDFEWCAKGIKPHIDDLQNIPVTDFLDGWVSEHLKGNSVTIVDVNTLSKDSTLYKTLNIQDIKSIISMPIFIDNDCYGYIGFDFVKHKVDVLPIFESFTILPRMFASAIKNKRILNELSAAKTEADKANSVQKDFFAKVTHEIRTPINGVVNALYLLENTNLDNDQKQYTDVLSYSIKSLKGMVDNILSFSQIDAQKIRVSTKDISLESELVKLVNANKFMANSKSVGLYFDYDYDIPEIIAVDVKKLQQIMNNLIQNGIKYTNYGSVKVKVSLVKNHDPYVDIKFEIIDTGIGIGEEDLEKVQEEFYQVGDPLNKNPDGSGLGLTIANELIAILKSELKIESEQNKGSIFSFVLTSYAKTIEKRQCLESEVLFVDLSEGNHSNICEFMSLHFSNVQTCNERSIINFLRHEYDYVFVYANKMDVYMKKLKKVSSILKRFKSRMKTILLYDHIKVEEIIKSQGLYHSLIEIPVPSYQMFNIIIEGKMIEEEIEIEEIEEEPSNKAKLLLVDDNTINRKVMSQLIKNFDFDVTEAANGYEAIECVKKEHFDIVFMDIFMPGIDGYEATKRIRALPGISGSLPIIAVTANDVSLTKESSLEYGLNGVLFKPLSKEKLESLLAEYFPENSPVTDMSDIFNKEEFESYYDENLLRSEIVKTFLDDFDNDMTKIDEAFKSKDSDKIYAQVHYLKGSFTYLRANKLLDLSQKILDLCRDNLLSEAVEYESTFKESFELLRKELLKYSNS